MRSKNCHDRFKPESIGVFSARARCITHTKPDKRELGPFEECSYVQRSMCCNICHNVTSNLFELRSQSLGKFILDRAVTDTRKRIANAKTYVNKQKFSHKQSRSCFKWTNLRRSPLLFPQQNCGERWNSRSISQFVTLIFVKVSFFCVRLFWDTPIKFLKLQTNLLQSMK